MIFSYESVGSWISFVWCQCTVAAVEFATMTAFPHKYSNTSTNTKHESNITAQYAIIKIEKKDVFMCISNSFIAPVWWFYSTSDLYNHQCSLEYIYPYTQDLLGSHTCQKRDRRRNLKCRSAFGTGIISCRGNTGRRKRVTGGGGQVEGKAAVSGQVASLISVLHQQPPQLFPQLPPSDEHWPLSAATPQRENWSRHRSAEHTEGRGVQMSGLKVQNTHTHAQSTQ